MKRYTSFGNPDLEDFESADLVQELSERREGSDYYIAESIDEKMKLELFIEYVDKIKFTDMKQLFESYVNKKL